MVQKFYLKTEPSSAWSEVKSFFVKVSSSTWTAVTDAWVKVSPTLWAKFWTSATNPDTPIEILTSYDTNGALRLQGKNYHWSPSPQTLTYRFTHVDGLGTTSTLTASTSTTNPSSGSSITVPSSTTYRTVSRDSANSEFTVGGVSTYKFSVTGTMSNGSSSTSTAEYQMRTPKAPTLSVEKLSGTSVKITISAYSNDDYFVTNRYIVSTYDQIGGTIESGGGRGGYGAATDPVYVTLTGLTAGRLYYIYVTPFTGDTGSTEANAKGYKGETANITTQSEADYTFAFGNTLYVGTNGYIGLDSGSSSDGISSTNGRVIGVLPGDLYQDTTTSVWYWSDTNQFIIRWEGYHYNQPSNLRQYEIVFNKNNNYASVYGINVANTSEGTEAYVKNGIAQTSYTTPMGTGSWRYVYFDGITNPTSQFGPYVSKSKSVMKQVTGLTSGTQDQGYTAITTSVNQNQTPTLGAFNISSFTKGVVYSSAQGAARTTTLSWGSSSGATAYQIQYQGSNDNVNWTTVRAYSSTYNVYGTTDTRTWSTSGGDFGYYTFMRANVRSLEDTGLATYVYSDNGSYFEATGVAPGQPTFGSITATGTTASIPFTVGTQGTNYLYSSIEYQYRSQFGSYPGTWSTSVINNGAGTISLSGLSSSSLYYIKIRTKNYDELYSPENETNFSTTSSVSISSVSYNGSGTFTVTVSGGGPYYQIYWNTITDAPTGTYYDAASTSTSISESLSPTAGYSYYFWARSSTQNLGNTTQGGSSTPGTYSDYVGPYTIRTVSYNYNGGSGTTSLHVISDGSYTTLPSPLPRTGYTFNGWYTAASNGTYVGAGGGSYYVNSTLTLYAQWTIDTYTISYNAQGGTGAPSDQTKTYNVTLTLSSTIPTQTGYTFTGWNTQSNGFGTSYSAGGSYTNNVGATLYAQWTLTATAPGSVTGLTHNKTYTYMSDLSTTLTRITSSQKRQDWTYSSKVNYNLSWTATPNATGYDIAYSTSNSNPGTVGYTSTTNSYSDYWYQSDRNTVTYYYWVRATNAQGSGPWTSVSTGGASTASTVSTWSLTLVNNTSGATSTATQTSTLLSYTWVGVSTTALHYARISGTVSGTSTGTVRSSGAV
jgi:uncharacterized repeat protein (TIGR02543 family)